MAEWEDTLHARDVRTRNEEMNTGLDGCCINIELDNYNSIAIIITTTTLSTIVKRSLIEIVLSYITLSYTHTGCHIEGRIQSTNPKIRKVGLPASLKKALTPIVGFALLFLDTRPASHVA